MKILCATDFSEPAAVAARAAARLAAKFGARLYLVHVAQLPGPGAAGANETARRHELLRGLEAELASLGAEVELELAEGLPDERLLALAPLRGVELIVVGALGDRRAREGGLGSVAARVIKGATVPVLVVREDLSLAQWTAGKRPLRVVVGVDTSKPTRAALGWLAQWARGGPIEVCAAHVYQPGSERFRGAIEAREQALAAEVRERVQALAPLGQVRVRVHPGFGRVSEHLLEVTGAERADLLVIGTHRRVGFELLLHGSVSLDIVACSKHNVVTVPLALPDAAAPSPAGEIRRVLVPVDFSELSTRALHWARTLLPRGGTLQLFHVVAPHVPAAVDFGTYVPLPPPSSEELAREQTELVKRLRELAPADAAERGLQIEVETETAFDPATAIARAAQRLGSDVICLSTHGRSGWTKALLGSVAQGVVRRASVPVVIVPPHAKG